MEEKERQYEQHKFSLEQRRSELIRVPPRMCPVCKKGFSKRQQFQKHMKTHRPLLECQYCSFKCRSKKQYATHEARHLKDNPQFICDLCPMKFVLSSQLRAHMGRQHGIFYCPQCGHQSSSFEERNEHMLAEHSIQIKRKKDGYALSECQDDENQEEQNICGTCYKKCRSRALLRIHVAQHFNVDPNQLSDVLEPIRTEDPLAAKQRTEDDFGEDSQDGKVEYTLPSRPLKRSNEYVEDSPPHRKHPRMENVMDESYREHLNGPESYREHLNDPEVNVLARIKPASENALYRCSDCVIDLPSPMSLFLHVVTIHGFLEYDARRRMAQDGDLASNTLQTEAKISQPEKGIDPNRNRPGLNLNTHVRQFIPYFCRVCGPQKKFHKYTMYAAHMKTHRKLKKCSECNFSSTQTMRILIHQIKAHKRLFRCPRKCLQLFKTKQELETHKSTIDCKKD
ncbi:zinc finger protein 624-like [Hyalella azteca]|uniref:Zinc finger protein 624-like n=1 Tax=Hyalella azteca TaxID=294128 RepID=A0A8B7NSD1_HYAAZ|nr:zinc finger protein 624-like [Hyalella azteca]